MNAELQEIERLSKYDPKCAQVVAHQRWWERTIGYDDSIHRAQERARERYLKRHEKTKTNHSSG